jgi:hypothetical protein
LNAAIEILLENAQDVAFQIGRRVLVAGTSLRTSVSGGLLRPVLTASVRLAMQSSGLFASCAWGVKEGRQFYVFACFGGSSRR